MVVSARHMWNTHEGAMQSGKLWIEIEKHIEQLVNHVVDKHIRKYRLEYCVRIIWENKRNKTNNCY